MRRTVYDDLLKWKSNDDRKPLLLEGVRQCGKTYILKKFGKQEYEDVAYFTFHKNPKLQNVFREDLDPKRILDELSFARAEKIRPGKTLVILDEIQYCNNALASLKYFCEDAPEYHIACAGSLLGVLTSKPYSFPVGKVDRINMHPMTFKEFLLANSEDMLVEHIEKNDPAARLPDLAVDRLERHLDHYFVIGGMPAAVASWIKKRDIGDVERILAAIIIDYEKDFSKHTGEDLSKLTMMWKSIPVQLAKENNKFIFGHVKTGMRSKDLEDALEWLINAGLVHKVRKVDTPEVPLAMFADNTSFKVYLADIGIFRRMADMPPDFVFSEDKEYDRFRGAITENYVLNELVASLGTTLYYWRSGAKAEMDFVTQIDGTAVPIEAKAGSSKTKSLSEFINRYDTKIAVTTSGRRNVSDVVVHVPRYAVWMIPAVVRKRMASRNGPDGGSGPG